MKNEKINSKVVENSTKAESKQIAESNNTAKASEGKQNAGSIERPKADNPEPTQQGSINASSGNAEASEREEMLKVIKGMKEQLARLEKEKEALQKRRLSYAEMQELVNTRESLRADLEIFNEIFVYMQENKEKLYAKDEFAEFDTPLTFGKLKTKNVYILSELCKFMLPKIQQKRDSIFDEIEKINDLIN